MTPEEIAEKIVEGIPIGSAVLAHAIAQAITDAYERAAQTAEVQAGGHYMAKICATAIRALKGGA